MAERRVMTVEAPGYIPEQLTLADTTLMAQQMAACMAEAGHPCTPVRSSLFDDVSIDWHFDPNPPYEILARARALVFLKWGFTEFVEVSDRG